MPAKINLLNQTFGKLKVIEETPKRKNGSVVWKCQCTCGNIIEVSTKELRSDGIIQCPNCGKARQPNKQLLEDIVGKKFNHLTVLNKTQETKGGKILYQCECDCSEHNIIYVSRTDLLSGHTKSCGCIKRKLQIENVINNRQIIGFIGDKNNNNNFYYKCKCLLCGCEYEATYQTLRKTISCGCQKSIGEYNIIQILKDNNINYQKEYCFPGSLYRFDFAIFDANNKLTRLIEFDGEQHYTEVPEWRTTLDIIQKRDKEKNEYAITHNIPLVRIPYWERGNITLEMLIGDQYLIK